MVTFGIETALPGSVTLRNPNRFLVEGWIYGSSRLRDLSVTVGDRCHPAELSEAYRPDILNSHIADDPGCYSLFSGFSVPVVLKPVPERRDRQVTLHASFRDGQRFSHSLGSIRLEPWKPPEKKFSLPAGIRPEGLLVICMATYNPVESRFRRQVESIRAQDFTNWICLVSDDCSKAESRKQMRAILAEDPRFFFIEHGENAGFYRNFERCLETVPAEAEFVALSDQDDRWYPNKLSECLKKLRGDTQLVYCDMRIVHENGTVISGTYWKNRKNYYRTGDLDLLVIANTVTGAASVFRASLLDRVLPFPPRYGEVFHDSWIAVIAAASGGIQYVDEALYDYMQSSRNVIGHCDFGEATIARYLRNHPVFAAYREQTRHLPVVRRAGPLIRNLLLAAHYFYAFKHVHAKHIATIIETASCRGLDCGALQLIRRPLSFRGLLTMHRKVAARRETTGSNEVAMLFSKAIHTLYAISIPLVRRATVRRFAKGRQRALATPATGADATAPPADAGEDPWVVDFKRKFSGRSFEIAGRPRGVNVLLSWLDAANFFGGYMAMFNVARRISEAGYPVRVLLTDQREIQEEDLQRIRTHDASLQDFLSKVECVPCFSSAQPVPIARDDIFLATSWWTAHIAREAVSRTDFSKFIYLTQDYEAIFYENGAYRVLADQSYRFDYFPIVSTDILRRFFIEEGIMAKERAGVSFNNPVLRFSLTEDLVRGRGRKKRLLFYARPQPHAARNLYYLGCLALDRARDLGCFPGDEWEVIGIGADIREQQLPSGLKVRHIGRFDLQKYRELLPQHDLGLALMHSPHPSLLPVEMAAAGLVVVTNTYGIKDQQYFSSVSPNITSVSPEPESLAEALMEASKRVGDVKARIDGSKVNWPHDWDEAVPDSLIKKALEAVEGSRKAGR